MTARVRVPAVLGLIVAGYLALAILYAVRVPTWNAPDEPAHYNVIRSLAVDHRLPVLRPGDYNQAEIARLTHEQFPPGDSIAGLRYESHQPPLYYLLEAPIFLIAERAGTRAQVIALRLGTSLIGALVILATYRLAHLIFPERPSYSLAAAAFVAFVPMHVFMDAAIDNDALVELMLCLVLIVLVKDLIKPRIPGNDLQVGAAAGLAALAKLDGGVSALLITIGFIGSALRAEDRQAALRQVPLRLVRAGGVALVLSGWWFLRNLLIYGPTDPFALRRHAEVVVGQPLTGDLTRSRIRDMLLTVFHSFWGQFGWMGIPYSDRTYDVLATLSLLVALGVALYLWRLVRSAIVSPRGDAEPELRGATPGEQPGRDTVGDQRKEPEISSTSVGPLAVSPRRRFAVSGVEAWGVGLLLLEILLVIIGVVFYNLRYLQPQGRYLFPALPALAILSVAGVGELFREEHIGLVLTLTGLALYWLCVFSLFQVIGPAFVASR